MTAAAANEPAASATKSRNEGAPPVGHSCVESATHVSECCALLSRCQAVRVLTPAASSASFATPTTSPAATAISSARERGRRPRTAPGPVLAEARCLSSTHAAQVTVAHAAK